MRLEKSPNWLIINKYITRPSSVTHNGGVANLYARLAQLPERKQWHGENALVSGDLEPGQARRELTDVQQSFDSFRRIDSMTGPTLAAHAGVALIDARGCECCGSDGRTAVAAGKQ
jgi:hypothetical protein